MGLNDLYNDCFEADQVEAEELEKIAEAEAYEEEAMEKVASDYVAAGRFMARGYADEMEKLAADSNILNLLAKMKDSIVSGVKKTRDAAKKAWKHTTDTSRYGRAKSDFGKAIKKREKYPLMRSRKYYLGKAVKGVAPELIGVGALGTTGYGLKKALD